MKTLILNGSPKGKNSVTLHTCLYIQKQYPEHSYEILDVGQKIRSFEKDMSSAVKALEWADLIVFCYPVYTFLAPAQLHRFIRLMKESGCDVSGKFATQITTSKHFFDVTAHRFIQDNCADFGLKYIKGLSADMEDLPTKQGQRDARKFWRYVEYCVRHDLYEPASVPAISEKTMGSSALSGEEQNAAVVNAYTNNVRMIDEPEDRISDGDVEKKSAEASWQMKTKTAEGQDEPGTMKPAITKKPAIKRKTKTGKGKTGRKTGTGGKDIVIVASIRPGDTELSAMIAEFQSVCPYPVRVMNIEEFPFQGGCISCFHCAADGTCIYKDGFADMLREQIQSADAILYAFTIQDHSMGPRFKLYDDRQFCNGHRTVTMGMPMGYLIAGNLEAEENLRMVIEARCEVGYNFLCGMATNSEEIRKMNARLLYALRHAYVQPQNFYGVGGMKIFRDLIYVMRGFMKADHQFYKKNGIYDFPQKKKGQILLMMLVGALMNNPKLRAKAGKQMTEGMVAPYKKVLEE
ncbi:MAG: NAD(P)H-dependent oxidoreductase [Lachnospiraceae bacterium]|nr:NAD(P)H-dependent oxidoreductase [Lachnospiraceae bacterium]